MAWLLNHPSQVDFLDQGDSRLETSFVWLLELGQINGPLYFSLEKRLARLRDPVLYMHAFLGRNLNPMGIRHLVIPDPD